MPALSIRPPAVAGRFYPSEADVLRREVEDHLESAVAIEAEAPVKAVIAPHAGYVYSGPIAGSAFRQIVPRAWQIERVVLVGPAHRVALRGLALAGADGFETPLGEVPVDGEAEAEVAALPQVSVHPAAHAAEHSLEVELPFLQVMLERFALLALVVGEAAPGEVAEVFERVWGGEETLVVVSSDLSHYLPYDDARHRDAATADKIVVLEPSLSPYDACGARAVNGLLTAGARRGLTAQTVDLRNSGDTAGGRDEVVGYGAFCFRSAHEAC